MPKVHHIGPKMFAHQMTYPPDKRYPLMEPGETQEIEYPFRSGRSLVFRVPFTTRALAVGVWTGIRDETDALEGAIGAKWITDVET